MVGSDPSRSCPEYWKLRSFSGDDIRMMSAIFVGESITSKNQSSICNLYDCLLIIFLVCVREFTRRHRKPNGGARSMCVQSEKINYFCAIGVRGGSSPIHRRLPRITNRGVSSTNFRQLLAKFREPNLRVIVMIGLRDSGNIYPSVCLLVVISMWVCMVGFFFVVASQMLESSIQYLALSVGFKGFRVRMLCFFFC